MDKVDLLCNGAEALLDQHDYDQDSASFFDQAAQLLDEAGEGAGVVDDLLQSAIDREMEARAAGDEAEQALTLAGTDLRDPGQVLDVAEETSSQVRAVLIEEEPSPDVRNLKDRVRHARVKIRSLRSRLPQR
ncbi:hypothetical protein [Micromonospora sp. RL09-050-HVF-A]|uniref:hypothetical protein n=1 Tax=Micromonospora sp. RL09-050-HVF-A TaxID=1703433 RepID=UPI001C5FACC9|nr:hypothetical protein [Micromonospora sp. RL09-050-HVF-A]MBW4704586.1 hypothetical protein [Micromonospora sp. RL09-050-HVF-A]